MNTQVTQASLKKFYHMYLMQTNQEKMEINRIQMNWLRNPIQPVLVI